jgi:cytoskeleton protein RodZ
MPSFGEELKQAREERGISLRQISDATHIGIRFLQAIESDNYAILPGGIFNRSFVKSYARYIGIDEEQALARYNQQLEEMGGEPPRTPATRFEGIEDDEPSSWGSISLIIIILVILGLGGYGAYRYFTGDSAKAGEPTNSFAGTGEPVASAANSASTTASPEATPQPEANFAAPAAEPSPTAVSQAQAAEELRVQLHARDAECWIKVKTDENQPETKMLQPGETRIFRASDKIVLNLGNMPSLSVTLNGRPAKLPTRSNGTVAENVIITRDNYQKFIE